MEHSQPDIPFSLNANMTASDEALQQWITSRTGPMTGGSESMSAYFRLPKDSPVLTDLGDPSAGPNTPHYGIALNVSPSGCVVHQMLMVCFRRMVILQ